MIVLTEEKTFAEFNTINQGELYVKYIKHKEKPQQKKEKEKESYTRWQEIPQLVFADTTPETGVKLAKITLEEGAITKVVTDVREYSGLSLPTSDGTELTLRYGGKRQSTNEAVLTGSLHIDQDLTVDGQLGIGTNTPEAKLHIHGELKLQEGVKVNKISNDVELQEDSDQIIPTQKAIKTYADNTKALLAGNAAQNFNAKDLTVEGRLEIKGKMDVQDNIYAKGLILPSAGRENTKGIKFHSKPGGGKGDSAWIRYDDREGEKTTLEIGTGKDNYGHIALMPSKGNVGIGTNTPEAKLEIKGNLKLEEGVAVNSISNDVNLGNSDQIIPTQKAIKTYADNTKALLAGNAAQNFNAKDLTVEGRLEIKGKMDVQDYISANGLILPSAGRENTRGIKFHSKPGGGKGDSAWIRYYVREGEKTTLEIGTGNDNYDHIALMPEKGNVGIGTNKPQAKLDIKGNLKLEEGVAVKNISNDESLQEDSDEIIPTQNAIKRYIDKKVNEVRAQILHRGMIMLWPVVKDSTKYQLPKGWKDCDGKNGRPSISGRLVCGYDISRKGLEEMKMAMDQSGSSISRMKFIGSVGNASDDFLYGNNVSVDGNGTELWMNYKLVESMIPNHKHVGRSRLSGEHNHGLRLTENGSDKLYFSGEYSVNKCSRFESALWHAQEPYRNVSSRDAHIAHGGEHDHHVTVGGGVGEGCEGTATVSQLPRPPLIVLRYIIYWPD
jgi:hypothetical protein